MNVLGGPSSRLIGSRGRYVQGFRPRSRRWRPLGQPPPAAWLPSHRYRNRWAGGILRLGMSPLLNNTFPNPTHPFFP